MAPTITDANGQTEVLDEEAVQILNTSYSMNQPVPFWMNYDHSHTAEHFIKFIRRDRKKEPDFAEGENEPDSICTPPTRAGS